VTYIEQLTHYASNLLWNALQSTYKWPRGLLALLLHVFVCLIDRRDMYATWLTQICCLNHLWAKVTSVWGSWGSWNNTVWSAWPVVLLHIVEPKVKFSHLWHFLPVGDGCTYATAASLSFGCRSWRAASMSVVKRKSHKTVRNNNNHRHTQIFIEYGSPESASTWNTIKTKITSLYNKNYRLLSYIW